MDTASDHNAYIAGLKTARRVVIKIGSALLVDSKSGAVNAHWLTSFAQDVNWLRTQGAQVVIVSSGAIALGRSRLGLPSRALRLEQKQASAAAGQALLTQSYEAALAPHNIITAQALLTLMDTEDRRRWLNARRTLDTLLSLGAVPIINENDTVATDEIRYGDNDRLAARVAQMVGADSLILLSDIDGLYTADPRQDPGAQHIPTVEVITHSIDAMGGGANASSSVGTGGMATKIAAARIAVAAGCHVCVTTGHVHRPIDALIKGAKATWFKALSDPKAARKQWILGGLSATGRVTIDAGASRALTSGKSLLPAGIVRVSGDFETGDAITLESEEGQALARGLTAYSAAETSLILGKNSDDINAILGYSRGAALIHRDDLALLL